MKPALEGIRVLLVDDDRDSLELMAFCLERCGAHVTTCGTAASAPDAFRGLPPDVIVSDLSMPGHDGYWLIRQIRGSAGDHHVPALAVTAYGGRYRRDVALSAGFQDQMAKPVDPDALCAIVARLAREGDRDR